MNIIIKKFRGQGIKTVAYDAYAKPLLACAPRQLCLVELQVGEHINQIALGDAVNWHVATSLVGTEHQGAYQVLIWPTLNSAAWPNKNSYKNINNVLLTQKLMLTKPMC